MMLPIPDRLLGYVSTGTSSRCFVEIETLLDEGFLKNNFKAKRGEGIIQIYEIKDSDKSIFWKDFDLERLFRFVSETFVPHPQVSFLK